MFGSDKVANVQYRQKVKQLHLLIPLLTTETPLNTLVSNLVISRHTNTSTHTEGWSTFAGANGLRNSKHK